MARLGTVGDRVIVMAFAELEPDELQGHQPRVVALDHQNQIVERIDYPPICAGLRSGSLFRTPSQRAGKGLRARGDRIRNEHEEDDSRMRQVLFTIPIFGGIKVFGYGAMLVLAFVGSTWMATWRARREKLDPEVILDMAFWIFLIGLIGARLFYCYPVLG